MKKILFTAIIAVGAQTVGAQDFVPQQGQTIIYVKPAGTGDGSSWANACNLECVVGHDAGARRGEACLAPTTNTQIWVQKGTYYPSAMLSVPNSVKMYGGFEGTESNLSQRDSLSNSTIIDARKNFGSVVRLSPFAELNGFTIQNGNSQKSPHKNGGGIWADDNSMIANCKIINNSASVNGGGLYAKGAINIKNCTIENNTALVEGANAHSNCISGLSAPIINSQPNAVAQSKPIGTAFPALSVSVAGSAPYSYQWYSNTANNNTSGTLISGATGASYTPPSSTTTLGTFYYYCKITDLSGTTVSNVSGAHTVVATGCASGTFNFGTVSFVSVTTRTITGNGITQVWSDAVTATGCQKTTYNGGSSGAYRQDCRKNSSSSYGDLFSWCAVVKYASTLCPAPWRVPTKDDFINLDKAMGGTGVNRDGVSSELPKYVGIGSNQWGGAYGGNTNPAGSTVALGSYAQYWSQTEAITDAGYNLRLMPSSGYISPQSNHHKYYGFTLRCVR